ncbi:MAG: glycosyltransferase [Aeromicrobium sp.]
MPDSFNIALLYIPLSVIGLWRWSYWLIRRLGAAAYRPGVTLRPAAAPRLSVSVVTPVYNEDPEVFDRAVRSWQRNGVDEIIAVIDKSNVQHIVRCQRDYVDGHTSETTFRLVVTPKPGKRAALCDGIELATSELVALVDSDTVWADDVLSRTEPYFADAAIGGATVAQRISNPTTVGNVLFDILLWTRYREEVPFLLGVGRVFNTLSGRTAFYRRDALLSPDHNNMHALRHEFFLGARAVSGDDKRLSHLIIRQGWETAYVLDTCVYTPGLGSLREFVKQRLRWTRNSWRADLKAVARGWVWQHPALAFFMIDRFLQPFLMLVGPVVFALAVMHSEWLLATVLVTWWLGSRLVRVFGYFRHHPGRLRYLPAFTVYGYVNAVLKIYALGTLLENSWATRWNKNREARKSVVRKGSTLVQGGVAVAVCLTLLTYLALSFRSQVGADVQAQPYYDAKTLQRTVDSVKGQQVVPTPPAEKKSGPGPTRTGVYVVRPGDTLSGVAQRLQTTPRVLKRMNDITDRSLISVGQRLRYPENGR